MVFERKHQPAGGGVEAQPTRESAESLSQTVIPTEQSKIHNLSELLPDTADIIIADVVKPLFIFTLDRLALTEDNCVRGNNAEVARIGLNNLQKNRCHNRQRESMKAGATIP